MIESLNPSTGEGFITKRIGSDLENQTNLELIALDSLTATHNQTLEVRSNQLTITYLEENIQRLHLALLFLKRSMY